MKPDDYPALYRAADAASNDAQRKLLHTIRVEYIFLFVTAAMAAITSQNRIYNAVYACIFIVPIALVLYRYFAKPERRWYAARALAESVKTMTWRYVMKAEPFESDVQQVVRSIFRDRLLEVLKDGRAIGGALARSADVSDQTTPEMERIRSLDWSGRLELYRVDRLANQQKWYAKKASDCAKLERGWTAISIAIYGVCIAVVIGKVVEPSLTFLKPGPIIVYASAALGWVQTRRYSELSSSYSLTAHEISIARMASGEVDSEIKLAEYVRDTELVFSREHTQWVARR